MIRPARRAGNASPFRPSSQPPPLQASELLSPSSPPSSGRSLSVVRWSALSTQYDVGLRASHPRVARTSPLPSPPRLFLATHARWCRATVSSTTSAVPL
ncbi:hypothetical protein BO71DRAFT_203906 [Aspergillus ellipticus CBS 707.79]|uniref:Uncharacterized protein n=1 Tax=Aspergillus ellipticus CBS 707.79 TaxID=1448320 RepID=A0A319EVF9_9EURO|nr:hypothetical protein BO71DRAFT_203906 [Aspergillus ellipticus CBS 707.79]